MAYKIKAETDQVGQRADLVAAAKLNQLSRNFIYRLFQDGHITLNGSATKPGTKLRLGDVLDITFDLKELDQIPEIELPVIYEDENVLVINKPVGIISHSRGKYWYEPSVASFIRQKTGQTEDRAGIVHRLDRATSGVMICAKNNETLRMLQKQFSQRKVHKTYIAVVQGHLEPTEAVIEMPIERNPKQPQVFRVGGNGREAITQYKVLKSLSKHDLVELKPKTGRTHQLRVHMKQVGHSITGDTLYGKEPFERLMLHASELEITLPGSERKVFKAPLPKNFKEFETLYG